MKKILVFLQLIIVLAACGKQGMNNWRRVNLPDGFGDSHILSIDIRGNDILLGTYGRGALFSRDAGLDWTKFDTTSGLSWNFILGGDWNANYMVLATLGDGVNISKDGGESWERFGYNFFGIEYLYTVGAKIYDGITYVPTADGLVVFDSIADWKAITEAQGIGSQYIYDMVIRGNIIALGTLHGYSISCDRGKSWKNFSPNSRSTPDGRPDCKVRAVEFNDNSLFAGCDDGLYVSDDKGASWRQIGKDILASQYIHDLVFDQDNNLWVATYKEVALYNLGFHGWKTYDSSNGLPDGDISCLGVTTDGGILAGTHLGLFKLEKDSPTRFAGRHPDAEFFSVEEPAHQWMLRPIEPYEQNLKDQTYLYGSTMGGNFRQHQGNEYNDPQGTPILAVDDGTVVFTDSTIGHTVLKCDRKQGDFFVYAHYHHQWEILKKVGERVKRGDIIGKVGKKGNVTNEHLHFEVSLSTVDDSNKESTTRNPELWVEPLPGTGTVVGNLVDGEGNDVGGARIFGIAKPVPTETPFSFAETYLDKVHPDESYNENFVISDVPQGEYVIYADSGGKSSAVKVKVEAGRVTRARMVLK